MLKLNSTERANLEMQHKQTRDLSEWKRVCVILGYDDGISVDELARHLRLSPFTIEDYLKEYIYKNKTKNDPRGGSSSKITESQEKELEQHLSEKTYLKVKHIVAYVKERYGIEYSRSGMTDWLSAHKFAFKRPKKVPGKLDPEKQKAFIEKYEELKKSLSPEEKIYFVDAVHPEYQSHTVCGWIKKSEQKTLQTTGKQPRIHLIGAVCLTGMQIITGEYSTIDADAMINFFEKLESRSNASVIHLILDNAKSNKNKKIAEFVKTSRIKLHYLPPYSPNLNSIERLWKVLKETKIYNRYYESSVDFFKAIRRFFSEDIPKMVEILKSRINDNFQIIQLNPVSLG